MPFFRGSLSADLARLTGLFLPALPLPRLVVRPLRLLGLLSSELDDELVEHVLLDPEEVDPRLSRSLTAFFAFLISLAFERSAKYGLW